MKKLQEYLKRHRWTQRQFAKIIKVGPNYLGRLISGKSIPSLPLALLIWRKTGGMVSPFDWLPTEGIEAEKENEQEE